jgi:Fe-S-cluster-containing hydrogenase component 2
MKRISKNPPEEIKFNPPLKRTCLGCAHSWCGADMIWFIIDAVSQFETKPHKCDMCFTWAMGPDSVRHCWQTQSQALLEEIMRKGEKEEDE